MCDFVSTATGYSSKATDEIESSVNLKWHPRVPGPPLEQDDQELDIRE